MALGQKANGVNIGKSFCFLHSYGIFSVLVRITMMR